MTDLTLQARAGFTDAVMADCTSVPAVNPYHAATPDAVAWTIGAWLYLTDRPEAQLVRITPSSWAMGRHHLIYVDDSIVRWSPNLIEVVHAQEA